MPHPALSALNLNPHPPINKIKSIVLYSPNLVFDVQIVQPFIAGLGGLTGDPGVCKLSGEPGVLSVAHPWMIVTSLFLACVHQVTGIDLLTAFSVLITVVAFVSLLFH